MNRDNHYEAAFEAYLRERKVGFLAVDEAKRSLLGGDAVKSLDFVVVGPDTAKLVVDVKGRKFPGGPPGKPRKVWENWSTRDDVDGLDRWAAHFGADFRGVLAFVYHVQPTVYLPPATPDLFTFREQTYLMRGVEAGEYRVWMTPRSPKWGTVHLPTDRFRECVRPFAEFLECTHHKNTKGTKEDTIRERIEAATTHTEPIPD